MISSFEMDTNKSTKKAVDDQNGTIFIRNLSYDTEEDTLKEFMEKNFGETVYCLICRDKETGDSRGTAFIRFSGGSEVAQTCLKEYKDPECQIKFHLEGRNIVVLPALPRDKIQEVQHASDKKKDKRNLSLSKEGFINPNSVEAQELSKSDLEKRKSLHMRKKELLQNLHNFVSDTRLCIHNLPQSVDDAKLRRIFEKAISDEHPSAKIVECRVMKNKKGNGILGSSKGFGFVAFSKHDHAIAALHKINNNPAIFSKDKRPIVEFSIENLVALNKKKTRLVNSQRKNKNNPSNKTPSAHNHGSTKKPAIKKSKKLKQRATSGKRKIDSDASSLLEKIEKVKKQKRIVFA